MRKTKASARLCQPENINHRNQPEVIMDFLFEQGLFHVAVANISNVPAYSVSVKFNKPFRGLGGTAEISSLPLFRELPFLAPHKRIETFLDTSSSYFQRREPTRITALVSFRDAERRSYERRITHNLNIYKQVTYLLRPAARDSLPTSAAQKVTPQIGEPRYGSAQR